MTKPGSSDLQARPSARVSDLGQSWVDDVCDALRRDGRRPAGMWPGTLSEARALAGRALAGSPGSVPTRQERERLAHAVHAAAKQRWLSSREPEEVDLEAELECDEPLRLVPRPSGRPKP